MLGDILFKLRTRLDLSQSEVAKKLNIPSVNYNRYEKNQRTPDNETLVVMADFFNVTVDYLLGRTQSTQLTNEVTYDATDDTLKSFIDDLTTEEKDKLIDYIKFLKSQRDDEK